MRALLGMAVFSAACAPAYHPAVMHPTLFDEAGDLSVVGAVTLHGPQLAAAYAPVDRIAIRARGQYRPPSSLDRPHEKYWLAAAGVEYFDAPTDVLRVSVGAELGYGRVDAFDEVEFITHTTIYSTNGSLMQVAIPFAVGFELGDNETVATGLVGRAVAHTVFNDVSWSGRTEGTLGIAELGTFFRVGGAVKLDGQLGLSLPLYRSGDIYEGYFPVWGGIGVMLDLERLGRRAPEPEPFPERPVPDGRTDPPEPDEPRPAAAPPDALPPADPER